MINELYFDSSNFQIPVFNYSAEIVNQIEFDSINQDP